MEPLGDRPKHAVVAVIRSGDSYLTIKRAAGVIAPGKVCFPGGGVEVDETEIDGLAREIREELGVEILVKQKVWQSVTPWGVHVSWYLADLISDEFDLDIDEVDWCRWMKRGELENHPDLLVSNLHFFDALRSGELALPDC